MKSFFFLHLLFHSSPPPPYKIAKPVLADFPDSPFVLNYYAKALQASNCHVFHERIQQFVLYLNYGTWLLILICQLLNVLMMAEKNLNASRLGNVYLL